MIENWKCAEQNCEEQEEVLQLWHLTEQMKRKRNDKRVLHCDSVVIVSAMVQSSRLSKDTEAAHVLPLPPPKFP